jgi:hypothetical protein
VKRRLLQSSQVEKAQAALTKSRALYGEIPGQLREGPRDPVVLVSSVPEKFLADTDKLFPEEQPE